MDLHHHNEHETGGKMSPTLELLQAPCSDAEWLEFGIDTHDGGQYSPEYGIDNILKNDVSVYSSRLTHNVNLILTRVSRLTPLNPAPFNLHEVQVRIPLRGFTSPLRNGFIFMCSEIPKISDFKRFDTVPTMGLLDVDPVTHSPLPPVPKYVQSVLYFQLDHNTTKFCHPLKVPIRNLKYLCVKLLTSFGAKDSIDIEFIGFKGKDEKLGFPQAAIL